MFSEEEEFLAQYKTDFSGMALYDLSVTTKPTESQFGDLGKFTGTQVVSFIKLVLLQHF